MPTSQEGWGARFSNSPWPLKRRIKFPDSKALPDFLHRGRRGFEHLGDLFVDERTSLGVFAYVDLQKNASAV
jgi:hypothetical protein